MAKQYAASAGTKLFMGAVDADAAAITTQIADIRKFGTLPGIEIDTFDITTLDQEDPDNPGQPDLYEDYGAGRRKSGSLAFTMAFTDGTDDVEDEVGIDHAFKIVFGNGEFRRFNGFIQKMTPALNEKEDVTFEVSIMVKGKVYRT